MPRRPGSSRRLLPPYALQRVADLLGCERRQLGFRHRHHPLTPLLELHGSGRDLDLQPAVTSPDVEWLAGLQPQSLSQQLGDDDPPGAIDDSFHGTQDATKMALGQSLAFQVLAMHDGVYSVAGQDTDTRPARRDEVGKGAGQEYTGRASKTRV